MCLAYSVSELCGGVCYVVWDHVVRGLLKPGVVTVNPTCFLRKKYREKGDRGSSSLPGEFDPCCVLTSPAIVDGHGA